MTTRLLGHILRHLVHLALDEWECVSLLCTPLYALLYVPLRYAPPSTCLLVHTPRHLIQGTLGLGVCIPLSPFGHHFLQSSVLGNLASWLLCSISPLTPSSSPAASR